MLQISAVGPRSSTKNVSVPLPPVRKFEPVPPSSTLVPLLDRNGIFAAAADNKPIGCRGGDIQVIGGDVDVLLLQTADGSSVGLPRCRHWLARRGILDDQDEACR